jgi:hypothetical protein
MKYWIALLLVSNVVFSQQSIVKGVAKSNGLFVVEIVVNDTLSRLMKNPTDKIRLQYLKIYQDPRYVVRTDNAGRFSIKANPADTLYFKSYNHKTQKFSVADLLARKDVEVFLLPE